VAIGDDAVNAFAQSPPPSEPTFVLIDAQMREWINEQKGIQVSDGDARPVLCAFQGHPESGSIWADKVESYLKNDLKFTSPVHEPCLYIGTFWGQVTLIGRQVDDFKAAGIREDKLRDLFKYLSTKTNIIAEDGIMSHYNGIDIVQARDYIKIHVETYIDKIIKVHGWETASSTEDRIVDPIHPSAVRELEETAPPETEAECLANEKDAGFPYRSSVGELLYAYVTCRLDIGYAMGELSKLSTMAAPCHYNALKRIYRYLRQTKSDGIVFWRKEPRVDPLVPGDLDVPYPAAIDQLVGYPDAAHGTCIRTRRSMGAKVFCLAGAAVMYRAKWSVVICTSYTEAEFVVCVCVGKNARYLQSILNELGVIQTGPTLLNVDNIAAIMMANAGKPTERSRICNYLPYSPGSKLGISFSAISKAPTTHRTPSRRRWGGSYITIIVTG
jgi:hypothetical protein